MSSRGSSPVIVTRPLAQAQALADRVRACGREAIVFPLLDIQPLPDQSELRSRLAGLRKYALVVFVSPNAIDAAMAATADWPLDVPLAVMGDGSRAALARHGITDQNATIYSPADKYRTDSETLLPELDLDALRGKQVLIIRGESGRELLADALRRHDVDVVPVAAYSRAAPALDDAAVSRLRGLLEDRCEWIITSSEALRILRDMANAAFKEGGVAKLQHQRLVVPHARIAETARQMGFNDIVQTGSGDEAIVAALQSRS
jgi:uroporphyrinogen-III synthase